MLSLPFPLFLILESALPNKGYFNDFSPELQEIYKKYRNQKEHQERDLIVWDNYTQHSGGENKSNKTRYFILISLKKN